MASMEGRREVPDSEDEHMTSSPVNVSDNDTDKLFAMAHVPSQGAQDVPQQATRTHQATLENVANVNTARTDGLGADRNIDSINIDASKDEPNDLQPITKPSQLSTEHSNTADARLSNTAMLPKPGTGRIELQEDATVAVTVQQSEETSHYEQTEPEPVTASGTTHTSARPEITIRDEKSTNEEQHANSNGHTAIGIAKAQSPSEPTTFSSNSNQSTEGVAPSYPSADISTSIDSEYHEVGDIRLNERRTSQDGLGTFVNPQSDPSTNVERSSQGEVQTPTERRSNENDGTAHQLSADKALHASIETGSTVGAKLAVISQVFNGSTDVVAAESSPHTREQTNELVREDKMRQDSPAPNSPVSGSDTQAHEEANNLPVMSKTTKEPQYTSATQINPQASMAGTIPAVAQPRSDAIVTLDTARPGSEVHVQTLEQDQADTSTFSTNNLTNATTAPTPVEDLAYNSSGAHLNASNTTITKSLGDTGAVAVEPPTTTPDQNFNPQSNTSNQVPAAPTVATVTKTQQEITLDELRAQKSAMLASLGTLPAIRVLMEENASDNVDLADGDDEPTDADVMAAANKIVRDHIKLLHEYNELKDVGQGLMGLIADQRGVRIIEVQDEFGIDAQD